MTVLQPDREHLNFLREGRFMIQRCRDSGRHIFYPRIAEPVTGSTNLEWVEASGRAKVYAVTVVRQRPPSANYNVVMVDLAEGPRRWHPARRGQDRHGRTGSRHHRGRSADGRVPSRRLTALRPANRQPGTNT